METEKEQESHLQERHKRCMTPHPTRHTYIKVPNWILEIPPSTLVLHISAYISSCILLYMFGSIFITHSCITSHHIIIHILITLITPPLLHIYTFYIIFHNLIHDLIHDLIDMKINCKSPYSFPNHSLGKPTKNEWW